MKPFTKTPMSLRKNHVYFKIALFYYLSFEHNYERYKYRGGHSMKEQVIEQLKDRGVELEAIAKIVHTLQVSYQPDLDKATCLDAIHAVLEKREVQYAILTGIALDIAAEQGNIPDPILKVIQSDEPLYGVDEILAIAITNIYGTIGITSFGYLDKLKIGIIGELDSSEEQVNTFLDDLVAAIASASGAKIAHAKGTGLV